jgi:2'-5' RNA ligase
MAEQYTGAMIALLPSKADAKRLAVEGGLPPEQLHLTLCYLGDAVDYSDGDRAQIVDSQMSIAERWAPIQADAFAVSIFNPNGEKACIVLGIGGVGLDAIHRAVASDVEYPQKTPWVAHLTLIETDDASKVEQYVDLVGPITFDRLRVAFGGTYYDMPLSAGGVQVSSVTAAVNSTSWKSMPVAGRETKFNADEAIARIAEWAGGSADKFSSAFLWRNSKAPANAKDSYRLPIADVHDGRLVLIPHAVFADAAILSGAHGGLVGVVGDEEKKQLKGVVTDIYDMLRKAYGDPRTIPPWLRGGNEREDVTASAVGLGGWTVDFHEMIIASVNSAGWSFMPIVSEDVGWDQAAARSRVFEWADGDWRKYRRAFLWFDASKPEMKGSYKLPIADVVDGELHIVPRAVNAVAAVLEGARGGVDIPDADLDRVRSIVNRIQTRMRSGDDDRESTTAAAAPVAPPSDWFKPPYVTGPTPFTVTADGRVFGHIALWSKCHAGIANECVMAPHSQTGYKYFLNGQVLTSDGQMVKVGKITQGTGHAGPRMGWMPAADHYDNTGTASAIVTLHEDEFGLMSAGATIPNLTEEQIAELRRSPISGDWRRVNGYLELVAALAVNVPGFPIVGSIGGEINSLVAAGVLLADGTVANAVDDDEPEHQMSKAEKDMTATVDALDARIIALRATGRARLFDKITEKLDGRGK